MNATQRAAAALVTTLLSSLARAGDCSALLPDLDRDCERASRPAGFVAPVASPFLFEDAFVVTGAQAIHLSQSIPKRSALGGGEVEAAAGQLRIALTDRIGLGIAKAGALWTRPENPLIPNRQTPIPMTLGAKLALVADAERERWAAFALRYGDAFQGGGDGSLMPSIAGAARVGHFTLQGDLGGSWALDASFSSSVFWHAHAGFARWRRITPFVQLSGQHWVDGGDASSTLPLTPLGQQIFQANTIALRDVERLFGSFEGVDLVNLGAHAIEGQELVSAAAGMELRFRSVSFSAAYERPLSGDAGVFRDRVTTRVSIEL